MDSSDLTREQLQAMDDRLQATAVYLAKLQRRMFELGFPKDDTLYFLVGDARSAMHCLCQDLHGRTAKGVMPHPNQNRL
jgi:hypothetical protein